MSYSFQTNVTSLVAQQNLQTNANFQNQTITQLTSGYRINSSGDDAAGLSVANGLRNSVSELTQGVNNANNGVDVLQTVDGGLNNISQILDQLQTLATQSASSTFSGNRSTLNNEYQSLLSEITRQASNIGLNTGGLYNTNIGVFIGGTNNQANAQVNVDLSGSNSAVDATALGLNNTSVAGGGVSLTGNSVNLNNTAVTFAAGGSQVFTFNTAGPTGAAAQVVATVAGGSAGLTGAQVISSLNTQLAASGITASIGANGGLQFSGATAFTLAAVPAVTGGGNAIATTGSTIAANTGNYNVASAFATIVGTNETFTLQTGTTSVNVSLAAGNQTATIQSLNTQLAGTGVSAVGASNGTGIELQGANAFSINETALAGTSGGVFTALGAQTVTAPTAASSGTGNAEAAIASIQTAVLNLGLVQGRVGTGENVLADAINLATSQITNQSAAESTIRDANIAQEAANLTKSQVLQQSSIAALAQANSAPEALLKLFQ